MPATSLGIALASVAAAIVVGRLRPRWAPWTAAAAALVTTAALAAMWATGHEAIVDRAWFSVLGSRLVARLDPLAAPLAIFTTGVAVPIFVFTAAYLPEHLPRGQRAGRELSRFTALMLAFMAAMVLLLLSHDLLVMFMALELTALVSFFLIELDRHDPAARRAAKLALVLTMGSSLVFLLGTVLIAAEHGTTVLSELRDQPISPLAAACLALGVLAKSAQVPLHIWLPRAMVAPTPVSAYLHSATLVAAGVFVLQRLHVLLVGSPGVLALLQVVGVVSILAGACLALLATELKRILAYSTIAQHGYAVVMIGLGGDEGLVGAAFFIVAHGVCKCALFLTAGAVTSAAGAETLSEAGGLWRRMPLVAGASAVAAAGLAGAPLTIGYFKDELLFATAAHHGPAWIAVAIAAAALTVAYIGRFWLGIFAGEPASASARSARRPHPALSIPIVSLAALAIVGGLWAGPLERAFGDAGAAIAGAEVTAKIGYRFELRVETLMVVLAWAAGVLLVIFHARWRRFLGGATTFVARHLGPARLADRGAAWIARLSDWSHRRELRDLRDRLAVLLVCTGALVLAGLVASFRGLEAPRALTSGDLPLFGALLVTAAAAVSVGRPTRHVSIVLMLSLVGFAMGLTFALAGAPNVALIIVVIESLVTVLFLAVLWQLRPASIARVRTQAERARRRGTRMPWPGTIGGAVAFVLAWVALAGPRHPSVSQEHEELAPVAHAEDVVTAILADFRGLDTAGELTVFAIAILGAAAIGWGRLR